MKNFGLASAIAGALVAAISPPRLRLSFSQRRLPP